MSSEIDDLNRKVTILNRDLFSYTRDSGGKIAKRVAVTDDIGTKNNSPFGEYDQIAVTYPLNTREVYTYSLGGNSIGDVVVDYTDASKRYLSLVSYNGV